MCLMRGRMSVDLCNVQSRMCLDHESRASHQIRKDILLLPSPLDLPLAFPGKDSVTGRYNQTVKLTDNLSPSSCDCPS